MRITAFCTTIQFLGASWIQRTDPKTHICIGTAPKPMSIQEDSTLDLTIQSSQNPC